MRINTLIKWILIIALFVSAIIPISTISAEAASTSIAKVDISSGILNVHEKASNSSNKVGSLKNGTKVIVYLKTKNGWSEIRYNKKKAYVSTKYLNFVPKQGSYLHDTSKIYIYQGKDGQYTYTSTGEKYNDVWTIWHVKGPNVSRDELQQETSKELNVGVPASEYYTALSYPLKNGKAWKRWDGSESYSVKVTSMNKIIKTPAGTFKKVVEVKGDDGYIEYYAKSIGIIQMVYKGKILFQLIKIKNK